MTKLSSCPSVTDDSFGPYAGTCRGSFDFTLLFEEAILTIPLLAIFLLILPVRLLQLNKNDKKVVRSALQIYKLVSKPLLNPILSDTSVLILQHKSRELQFVFQFSSLRSLFYGPLLLRIPSTELGLLFLRPRCHSLLLLGFACFPMVNMRSQFARRSFLTSSSSCRLFLMSRELGQCG